MADKYVNATGVQIIKTWIEGKFATDADLTALSERVDDIVAEGGEPNVIEVVQKNGVALPVSNKTVNVAVPTTVAELDDASDYAQVEALPTAVSDLTNDGDGNSPFATQAYVQQNGGKIDVIQVNGTAQTITNKTVNITVPTAVSSLTNDADYQNETEVQALIDAALADITGIDFQVVQTLPATGTKGVIYLVPKTGTAGDIYNEYIWVEPTGGTAYFELIGTTAVDLSNYWTSTTGQSNTLEAMTVAEINAILNA